MKSFPQNTVKSIGLKLGHRHIRYPLLTKGEPLGQLVPALDPREAQLPLRQPALAWEMGGETGAERQVDSGKEEEEMVGHPAPSM